MRQALLPARQLANLRSFYSSFDTCAFIFTGKRFRQVKFNFFPLNRDVFDRLDEIIKELFDCLSDETRPEFTCAQLLELCLTALVE